MATKRLVSKKGGFAVGVPENVKAKKIGPAVTMTTADKVLSVVVAPVESGTISASSKAFMRGMKEIYTKVKVTRTEDADDRRAQGHGDVRAGSERQEGADQFRQRRGQVRAAQLRDQRLHRSATPIRCSCVPRVNAIVNSFEVIKKP